VTISPLPETPQVPLDTVLCDQPITLSAWPVDRPGYSYQWSTGDTTRTIQVDQPAILEVTMFDPNGCQSETVFSFVADGRPEVDLGPDRDVCVDDDLPDLDAGNAGASYTWMINGNPAGNNRTLSVDTSMPGDFEYTVEVIDPLTMCVGRDTLNLTIRALPDFSISSNPTASCGTASGEIDITFNTSGNFDYSLNGPTAVAPGNFDGPGTVNIPNLLAGNYTVTVTNTVSGCSVNTVAQLEDQDVFTVGSTGACDGDVELTLNNTPADFDYIIQDSDGANVATGSNQTVFSGLDPDTYFIEITDNTPPNCVETEEITVSPGNEPAFSFDAIQAICGTQGQIFITDESGGAATYTWSTTDGNILGATGGTSITVNQAGTYQVQASEPGLCDRIEEIEVTLDPEHEVAIQQTGEACDGEIVLSAQVTGGSGPYAYQWNTGQQSQQFTATTTDTYSVTVRDQTTGCVVASPSVDVMVEEFIEVNIAATPDCDNSGQIDLRAIPNTDATVTYEWQNPGGEVISTDQMITVSDEGTYTVTMTNENGTCTATNSFEAILTPILPEDILLEETERFCSLDEDNPGAVLDPGVFSTYEWRRIPEDSVISTARVFLATQPGTYEVTLYNGFTCATQRVRVLNDCTPVIYAPNAFTPNGDGLNDTFQIIPSPEVQDFTIVISNRWGEPVFKSDDKNFEWDGRLDGSLLPPGTYAYKMTFSSTVDSSIGKQEQFGSITLLR